MTSESLTWRDMNRDNPAWFDTGSTPAGYPDPIDVPISLRRGATGASGPGSSHRRACTYILQHARESGIRLVHGQIDPEQAGAVRDHAWVELPGNIAFDGDRLDFYPTDALRTAFQATAIQAYGSEEAARLLLQTGHPGPWSDAERSSADLDPADTII